MFRLLRLPIRQTSTTNAFLRTYASQQATPLPNEPSLTEGERYIFDKLTKELEPSELLVQDVSGPHLVHFLLFYFTFIDAYYGLRVLDCRPTSSLGGCGSFYAITIASEKLKGLPILKQHRTIKDVLKEDMAGLHGLQVRNSYSLTAHSLTNL